ncbi:MAG: nucleotide exchange factor GrpE [Myxococcaceae bacterium]|nr:nucleotide exchange factor GrpE [Myxococcaceae bacterium]
MPDDEQPKISTSISQDVIDAALGAVEKRQAAAQAAADAGDPEKLAAKIAELTTQLEMSQESGRALTAKLKDEHERTLRAMADLENFKKRAQREKEEVQKFGAEKLLKDFLPVLDNFDRALEHAKKGADLAGLETGVRMVRKLFEDTLGKHGVKGFESVGKPFDPNVHEAMQQMESADVPPNHVLQEIVRGFTLHERLVRPALVVIAKAKSEAPPAEAPATDGPKGS